MIRAHAIVFSFSATLPLFAQEPGRVAAAFTQFRAWPMLRQLAVLSKLERACAAELRRIDPFPGLPLDPETLPVAKKPKFLDPREWNEAGAPSRRVVKEGSDSWRTMRQQMPVLQLLPDVKKEIWYDWGEGKIVRRARPLTPEERCANLLRGFLPGTDLLLARVEAALDDDPRMRKLGRYFEHCYADLQANVYDSITLFEAWASGTQLAMPDIEVIAFAQW